MADDNASPFGPLLLELARMRRSNLSAAIGDVDKIIDLLSTTREQVAAGTDHDVTPALPKDADGLNRRRQSQKHDDSDDAAKPSQDQS